MLFGVKRLQLMLVWHYELWDLLPAQTTLFYIKSGFGGIYTQSVLFKYDIHNAWEVQDSVATGQF